MGFAKIVFIDAHRPVIAASSPVVDAVAAVCEAERVAAATACSNSSSFSPAAVKIADACEAVSVVCEAANSNTSTEYFEVASTNSLFKFLFQLNPYGILLNFFKTLSISLTALIELPRFFNCVNT